MSSDTRRQIGIGIVAGVGIAVALAILNEAYKLWPNFWERLQGGDGEIAYRTVYMLTIFLVLYKWLGPLRPLPVVVTPVSEPGPYAVLTVRNLGHGGDFYATAEILDVRQGGVSGGFRRLTMRPKWGMERRLPYASIDRRGTGDLCLAKSIYDETTSGMIEVHLTDEGKKQEWYRYERKDPAGGVAIDLEVTVIRKEAREFFRFLPIPRPYVGRFTVKGKPGGGIATFETPPAHWWSRFV